LKAPWRQLQRGWETRGLLSSIPADASVAAETQLVPLLAQRRVLLRFPESSAYTDEQKPGFNADYAPAFRRNAVWVRRSQSTIAGLLESGSYRVHRCDQRGIVLRHVQTGARQFGEPSDAAGASCVDAQFDQALLQMKQRGDASQR
jgi:hypothetical protein